MKWGQQEPSIARLALICTINFEVWDSISHPTYSKKKKKSHEIRQPLKTYW